jgi:hypothetical protein
LEKLFVSLLSPHTDIEELYGVRGRLRQVFSFLIHSNLGRILRYKRRHVSSKLVLFLGSTAVWSGFVFSGRATKKGASCGTGLLIIKKIMTKF